MAGINFLSPVPNFPRFPTNQYLRVAGEADQFGFADGQVNKGELQNYRNAVMQNMNYIGYIRQFYGPQYDNFFNQYTKRLQRRVDIASILQNNFQAFASADPFNPNAITQNAIFNLAGRDGVPGDISGVDILPQSPRPVPFNLIG